MSRILLSVLLLIGSAGSVVAVQGQTALAALRVLPPEDGVRLARIDGCDGTPTPERWHFLVYDPQTENGYREYVVAGDQVVARREVSQFGSEFHSTDIIGNTFRIDSDRAARLALQYAAANNLPVVSMNYEMRRGSQAGPVWEVTCFDRDNRAVGWLHVNAEDESVVAQTGFARAPMRAQPFARAPMPAQPPGHRAPPDQELLPSERPALKPRKAKNPETPLIVGEKPERHSQPVEVRRAEPATPPPPSRKSFRLFDRPLFEPDDD